MARMTRVAVYGSLLSGLSNHEHFLGHATPIGRDWTAEKRFSMVSLGPYPGVLPGKSDVAVEVYEVDAETLRRLDLLEGHPVTYRREPVWLARFGTAELYILRFRYDRDRPVLGGNWRTYLAFRDRYPEYLVPVLLEKANLLLSAARAIGPETDEPEVRECRLAAFLESHWTRLKDADRDPELFDEIRLDPYDDWASVVRVLDVVRAGEPAICSAR
jgi:gamma-glutamylaminecyclotransferase